MSRPLVVANGLLGDQVRQRVLPSLRQALGAPVDWEFTTGPRDATDRVRRALRSGFDWIIAAGGDGTINEVVNGFFEAGRNVHPECSLSFLPLGSGNDWLRTLGVPLDLMQAVECMRRPYHRTVDAGLARFVNPQGHPEERVFVNFAEAGVGALLVQVLNERGARRNRAAYVLSAITTAFFYKPHRVELTLDGAAAPAPLLSFIVANGRFFGAGMPCAPRAQPDDGKLDVVTIGDFGRLELMLKIRKLVRGSHLSEPKVGYHAVTSLEASCAEQVRVQLDGDTVGTLPATFTVLPHSLRITLGEKAVDSRQLYSAIQ